MAPDQLPGPLVDGRVIDECEVHWTSVVLCSASKTGTGGRLPLRDGQSQQTAFGWTTIKEALGL